MRCVASIKAPSSQGQVTAEVRQPRGVRIWCAPGNIHSVGLEVNDCEHRERDRSAPRVMEVVLLKWGPLSFLGLNDGRWVSVFRFRASWGSTAVRGDSPHSGPSARGRCLDGRRQLVFRSADDHIMSAWEITAWQKRVGRFDTGNRQSG